MPIDLNPVEPHRPLDPAGAAGLAGEKKMEYSQNASEREGKKSKSG
jgi:hypothetical protein